MGKKTGLLKGTFYIHIEPFIKQLPGGTRTNQGEITYFTRDIYMDRRNKEAIQALPDPI